MSEIVFGVLMALSFTGALSVSTAGRQEIRTLLFTALGCNLAWGLVDAVMYLLRTATDRRRKKALLARLRRTETEPEACRLIQDALPPLISDVIRPQALQALHQSLLAVREPPHRLVFRDYSAAAGIFLLVVLATFPVVVPFIFIPKIAVALRVSNLLAIATLYIGGAMLGRYAGGRPWVYGLALSAIGVGLLSIIIALGG
ncbi:hypothetical protein [Caballeronia sp. ATUFL_M2_KS44]|uniref:hypothetical protein n=1 Tax=Caballeronia sp. ATUFL_M2_KS44 TaxID=2921767 RepID=UPI0020282700